MLRDVVTTYAGFFTSVALSFLTVRLMAQHMGPGSFGVATLANLFMAVIAGLAEPGIGTSLVRLASRPGMTPQEIHELVVAAIRLKLLAVGALSALAYMLMPWITAEILDRPELTGLLRACLLGAAPLSLAMFSGALFQMRGDFRYNAACVVIASAARAVLVLSLWSSGLLNLYSAVGAMVLMNVVQFGTGLIMLRPLLISLPWQSRDQRHWRELIAYAKCLVIWLIAGTIHPRADMLLLAYFIHDNQTLGFYSAAAQLVIVVPALTHSINVVLMPRISALRSAGQIKSALGKWSLGAVAVLLLLAPVALAAGPLVRMIFGIHYEAAVPIFRILIFAAGAELALAPLSIFWHALDRPGMLSVLNVVRLSVLTVVAALAIPVWAGAGAALAVVAAAVLPLTGQGVMLWLAVKKLHEGKAS